MLTVIGDVHGKFDSYINLTTKHKHTFQLGDLGFDYTPLNKVDPTYHKFIRGNHDNVDTVYDYPHYIGDWGTKRVGDVQFYCIGGAFSVDWKGRVYHEHQTGRKCWWPEEQLSRQSMERALQDYKKSKPSIVITHTCPDSIARKVGSPGALRSFGFDPDTFTTNTQQLLQACYDCWQPDLWIFGHFHKSWKHSERGTTFRCLKELETYTIGD